MASSDKPTELKSTEEINTKMRRSFSWDRAFYTNDGFLDAEELSSMIEGDGDDLKNELQRIEEIQSLEAKLFQEIEASTEKSTNSSRNSSSGKKDSRAKKVRAAQTASSSSSTPVKTVHATRSSPLSGGSLGNKVRSTARSTSSKTGKTTVDSPSKISSEITKNKVAPVNIRISRTTPATPVSSGSSSSKFFVNQRSKRGSSVPCRSSLNSEEPLARRNDEWKASKPAVRLIPKTQSRISLKIKPPPVVSSSSTAQCQFESSSSLSTCAVNQKLKSKGSKGSMVHHRSKSILKNRPTGQTTDQKVKQPKTSHPETRSPSASKPRKLLTPKTVGAVNAGFKLISLKTNTPKSSKKQSSAKAKLSSSNSRGAKNIMLVSPEVLDIKGKLNALKMEISMQKKDRFKETRMSHDESGKTDSSSGELIER
ncbi:hypothetical protein R6Q59_014841 [Mikania micrantha]